MITKSHLARLGLFDTRVPRYTSYPTAPQFGAQVGASQFADWTGHIPEDSQISLYLHVPFCRRLCWFCACRTQGTQTLGPIAAYVQTLKQELALLGQVLPKGVTLSRLHWGGGTPTLLEAGMIRDLAQAVFDVTPLAPGAEFSVEIDPNELGPARMAALAEAGMNRASIGVQDFDPAIQKVIGREQSYEVTRRAVDMIRGHGIEGLNADILFGLPHQSPAKITESVMKLLSLNPSRVALYGYAHVPWVARRQTMIPSDALPTPEARLELFETARQLFLWDGYDEIGIDHFALPSDGLAVAQKAGRLRRNFQGYTDDASDVLIGLGASSISRFPQGFAQNAPATSAYVAAVRDGRFSTARGHAFSGDDALRARLIEALMCDFRIDTGEILARFAVSRATLDQMFRQVNDSVDGLLRHDETGLEIPEALRPLTRIVAKGFDAYGMDRSRHSAAI
ncbi:MAG: oxygen-independent coproporphyrinogen III oxidase [Pseudooceanicola sp.]|nr:oxygen-independent coproporphyrinogen III oxidase [Pseudooceanicola sp.]